MGQKALAVLISLSLLSGPSSAHILAFAADEALPEEPLPMVELADEAANDEVETPAPEAIEPVVPAAVEETPEEEPVAVEEPPAEVIAEDSADDEPVIVADIPTDVATDEGATTEPASSEPGTEKEPEPSTEKTADEQASATQEETKKQTRKEQPVKLTDNHVVVVQDKKDKVDEAALDFEAVSAGDVLWANLLVSDTRLALKHDEGLSYRWLASDACSLDPKQYTEEVATTRDLTVTESLQGRYVIVEVTDGHTKLYGPCALQHTDKDEWRLQPMSFAKAEVVTPEEEQREVAAEQADEAAVTDDEAPELEALAVTTAKTPTGSVDDAWGTSGGNLSSGKSEDSTVTWVSMSEPLAFAGVVVVFRDTDALVLSSATGKTITQKKGALPATITDGCHPVLHGGIIYVPLSDGSVAALHASNASASSFLNRRWVSEPLGLSGDVLCSISIGHRFGMTVVILGATQAADNQACSGSCTFLNARNGKVVSTTTNEDAGYGQTGAFAMAGVAFVGDDAGVVHALDVKTGRELSSVAVSEAPLCGSVVEYGKDLLVMDRDGTLHRIRILLNGTLRERSSVVVGKGSTSSPVVIGNTAVCATCGPQSKESSEGALAIVDLKTMRVTKLVKTADGLPLAKGGITTEPLVSVQHDGVWCYFAINGLMGTVYRYRLGDAQATELYVPSGAKANRATCPLVCDAYGNLFYLNASGYVTKLVASVSPHRGGDTPESEDTKPGTGESGKPANEDEGKPSQGAGAATDHGGAAQARDDVARRQAQQMAEQQDMMARTLAQMERNRITPDEIGGFDSDSDDAFDPGMPEALMDAVGPDGRPLELGPDGEPVGAPSEDPANNETDDAQDKPGSVMAELMTVESGIASVLQSSRSAVDAGLITVVMVLGGLFLHFRKRT